MIYVIGTAAGRGPLKVGISKNPRARLASLQTGHPEPLVLLAEGEALLACNAGGNKPLSDREGESLCHFLLLPKRLQGEWFQYTLFDVLFRCEAGTQGDWGTYGVAFRLTKEGRAAYEALMEDREVDERAAA